MRTEILVQTLRERRRSLLWWTLGLAALVLLNVAFYPSVRDDEALSDYAKDLPESVRALFAGGELDLTSPAGYLNSQIFALTAPLVLLIFAIGAGAGVVAGEEERGALDLVLAHPVRRRDYVAQRFLGLATLILALTAVLLATVWLGSLLVDLEIGFDRVLAASVSVGLLALLYCGVALAVGSLAPGRSRSPPPRASRWRRGSSTASPRRSTLWSRGGRSSPTTPSARTRFALSRARRLGASPGRLPRSCWWRSRQRASSGATSVSRNPRPGTSGAPDGSPRPAGEAPVTQ